MVMNADERGSVPAVEGRGRIFPVVGDAGRLGGIMIQSEQLIIASQSISSSSLSLHGGVGTKECFEAMA